MIRRLIGHGVLTLRAWKLRAKVQFLASDVCYPLYRKLVMDRLPVNDAMVNAIDRVKPDLVIFPSSAYDPDGTDVARACRNAGVKSLFLIDNWDNLSSKSIMWARPDYLAVWGQQSREHAATIQGIPSTYVAVIGTPRFDTYFQVRDRSTKSHFDFPYVLFVGTALAFDEARALQILDRRITKDRATFGNVKIVYRPHPRRQGHDSIAGMNLPNVVVDPQVQVAYESGAQHLHPLPDLAYYPALIQNAEFLVGGLTSMLIETMIFSKRFLALVYDDGVNLTSQHNALRYYPHFEGIERLHAVDFCRNLEDLSDDFRKAWDRRRDVDSAHTELDRQYFLYADARPYKRRLAELVDDIFTGRPLSDRESAPAAIDEPVARG